MHIRSLPLWYACLAAISVLGLPGSQLSAADEAPADNQSHAPLAADAAEPGQLRAPARIRDLSSVRFALEGIQLAANNDQLGADVSQVDDVLRSHLGLGEGKGLVVSSVTVDGPAAKAGVQKNDVLISVGAEEIAGLEAFRKTLETSTEKPLTLGLIRAGKKQSVEVTPRATATRVEAFLNIDNDAAKPKYWLGLGLACADDTLRSQLSLPAGEGLVVTSVEEGSPALQAGVMVNDVLLQLNEKALTTIEALSEQLQSIADKSVPLKLLRRGKPAMLTVTPVQHAEAVTVAPQWFQSQQFLFDPAVNNPYSVTVQDPTALVYPVNALRFWVPGAPDAATQLGNIEAQVKQLEASLAALRTAMGVAPQPAASGEQKK